MAFENYANIAAVLQAFQIKATSDRFITPMPLPMRETFQAEIEFSLQEFVIEESEYSVCETLIFPVLREVYRHHRDRLTLWSHKRIRYDDQLCGTPDYLIAQRSPLGKQVLTQPYFATVEAKKDDFTQGWGQCLAQMVALQRLNAQPEQPVFGMVSNGQFWQFAHLVHDQFTQELRAYTISALPDLLGAVNYVFAHCGAIE
ncbi:MAG: hypothetical protein ACPGVO_05685 [Spirulinaceae cyanobacterium]